MVYFDSYTRTIYNPFPEWDRVFTVGRFPSVQIRAREEYAPASSSHTTVWQVRAYVMAECARCGNFHAVGFCPSFPQQLVPAPREQPTPTYDDAMRYLGARTLRTDGSGNQCLFFALAGEVSADGTVRESDGRAAALRMRAGALMRQGYARSLSREDDGVETCRLR